MDCSTARLFLPFRRPGGRDLDGPEAADLENHLSQCNECNTLAMTQDRLDDSLGKAMRAVEVPRGLRVQILERLAAQPTRKPRWVAYTVRGLSAAAAVLLLALGWFAFYSPVRRPLNAENVATNFNISRPAQDESNAQLRELGARAGAPGFVNYAFLAGSPSLAILPGTQDDKSPVKVPQLVFQQADRHAVVYVVSRRKFQLEEPNDRGDGYTYRIEVFEPERSEFAYLVLYTGNSWDWLKVSDPTE